MKLEKMKGLLFLSLLIFTIVQKVMGSGFDTRMDIRLKEQEFPRPVRTTAPTSSPTVISTATPTTVSIEEKRKRRELGLGIENTPAATTTSTVTATPSSTPVPFFKAGVEAPFTYNTNPAQTSPGSTPAWELDTTLTLSHSGMIDKNKLFRWSMGIDSDAYALTDTSNNTNNIAGKLDLDFTDRSDFDGATDGVGAPYIYISSKKSYVVDFSNPALSLASDLGFGWKERNVAKTGSENDRFEMDYSLSVAQRLIENGGSSTAVKLDVPFSYQLDKPLLLNLELIGIERIQDINKEGVNNADTLVQAQYELDWNFNSEPASMLELLCNYARNFSPLSGNVFDQWTLGGGFKSNF